jgi:hypothetical protein
LIASAWYKLGADLNRRETDERINNIGNSFLSQQRHLPSVNSPTSTGAASASTSIITSPTPMSTNNSRQRLIQSHPSSSPITSQKSLNISTNSNLT